MCRPDDYPPHTADGLDTSTADGYAAWARRGYRYDDTADALLTADECEAVGLDPTGRDGNPRFPYRRRDYARQLDAARYAEAIAGARAMRDRARTWADYTDDPAIPAGADATERAYGIPPWPAIDTE